jgi:uncharacterized protein (AIM24 family)
MTDTTTGTYTCKWCRLTSDPDGGSCPNCGAPVDVRLKTTKSGWTQMPPVDDMARVQFGQSSCQIEGKTVPAVDMNLAAGDSVYFAHTSLLWQDPAVNLEAMSMRKAWTRNRAGLPLVMIQATGPGHIAFSHDNPGELVAVPLQAGSSVDVREHQMVVATSSVAYDWIDANVWFRASDYQGDSSGGMGLLRMGMDMAGGNANVGSRRNDPNQTDWRYPLGQYVDRFTAEGRHGLVLVQGGGNTFVRDLAEGETLLVKPPSFLFKDPTVQMQLHVEYPHAGFKFWRSWGNRYLWLRLWGPGRVGVQSSYERLEDPGTDFHDLSSHTDRIW